MGDVLQTPSNQPHKAKYIVATILMTFTVQAKASFKVVNIGLHHEPDLDSISVVIVRSRCRECYEAAES